MSSLSIGIGLLFAVGLAAALVVMVRDVVTRSNGSGLVMLLGLGTLFLGERMLGEGSVRLPVGGLGLALVLGSVGLRYYAMNNSEGERQDAHRRALVWSGVAAASLLLYGLTLQSVTDMLGFDDPDALGRWQGVWWSLFPIGVLIGLIPTFMIDRLLSVHPVKMPAGAVNSLQVTGVNAALAIALLFPVNYLASASNADADLAYFRTTKPGESSKAIANTLVDSIEVLLFFPAGNDVGREILPYFEELSEGSGGRLSVQMVDQALDPALAEELKIRDNGHVVLRMGEVTEKFKLNTNIDRAKRELRKLDSTVQKHLIKLTRGQRTVYFLAGHGEANWREKDDQLRKINLYKRDLLEGTMSLKVKTFGLADGSANEVPEDADVVVVAGPLKPLLDDEVETLKRYWDAGGSMLVMVDPEGDPLTDLLAHLGVQPGNAVLAHAQTHAQLRGGPADRVFIATNKYGSHTSVKQLSRNSQVAHMVFSTAMAVTKTEETQNKVTTLIRTVPNTWEDLNGNYLADPDEPKQVFEIAAAITRPLDEVDDDEPQEGRAIVIGDVGFLSDVLVSRLQANAVFAMDTFKWLTHDEEIAGEVESEEDVKVQHTREEDWLWFLAAVVAVPGMVLLAGVLFIRSRQRRS
ncbi:MAG: GldG family protein [Myxococcales bacterium]|nr:GldG family protein [Myxococcales bacterium]